MNYFSAIDLIYIKNEIFSLPYEKIGNEIVSIFNQNFKNIEFFLNKIISFDFNKFYSKLLVSDLEKIDSSFNNAETIEDIKIILSKLHKISTL